MAIRFVVLSSGILMYFPSGNAFGEDRASYTVKTVEKRYSSSGVEIETQFITDAVRNDGSQVKIIRKIADTKQWVNVKTIIDLKSRQRIELEPLTESKTSSSLSARYVQYLQAKPKACSEGSSQEKSVVQGQEVIRMQNDYNLPSGEVDRVERWLAPALDCFPLREKFSKGPKNGPFKLKMTRDVTELTLGEPNASLFQVNPDFKERSASEVAAEFKRKYPKLAEEGCGPCTTTLSSETGP
jgi:hypothetical protein